MSQDDYEYRGLMAATWDLFRGDTSTWEDRFFFHDLIVERGQPVLDVGCGTGRLLLDFLSEGMDVEGVDVSPEMLALCRQKAEALGLQPALYRQAMEALDLPRRYQTIIVPSGSFQLVLDPLTARQAMQRFCEHLLPGGTLAMNLVAVWKEGDPLESDWQPTGEKVRPGDGALVRRWSRTAYDRATQLESTEDRYEVTLNDEVVAAEHHRRAPATRAYTQSQAVRLYEEAGLVDLQLFARSGHGPPAAEDLTFFIVGRKLTAGTSQ